MKYKKLLFIAITMVITLSACQQKGEKWFNKHQEQIFSDTNYDGFFVPDSTFLQEQITILVKHQKDLEKVNTKKLSEDNQQQLASLKETVTQSIKEYFSYFKYPNKYQICDAIRVNTSKNDINFKSINNILILSDSFYHVAKDNLQTIDVKTAQSTVEQHIQDFHWLSDTLSTIIQESNASEGLQKDLEMNIFKTQLQIKDYIGFVTSMRYEVMNNNLTKK